MEALCRVMATGSTQMAPYKYSASITAASLVVADQTTIPETPFPFLQLPFEIRLKIYSYLLPPRVHKVAPTLPFPLCCCLNSLLECTHDPSPIYKILNANSRPSYPNPTIYTKLFLICHQITAESEPLLYGHTGTLFDFGASLRVVQPFFMGRSALARKSVKHLKMAKEVPVKEDGTGDGSVEMDKQWIAFCISLPEILPSISVLELTFWSASGTAHCFPVRTHDPSSETRSPSTSNDPSAERKWKEWPWTKDLLRMENLRQARIKCWDFRGGELKDGQGGGSRKDFNSWLGVRAVSDEGLRGRGVWDGSVAESTFVVQCRGD